jgi:hypothetical protein
MRGVFVKPGRDVGNPLPGGGANGNAPPLPDDVAYAVSRKYSWTIVPSGCTALYVAGLSAQAPAVWTYKSDGPYKDYTATVPAGGVDYKILHTDRKAELLDVSARPALVIQALRALGKDGVSRAEIRKLSALLNRGEKQELLQVSLRLPEWVSEFIKEICGAKRTGDTAGTGNTGNTGNRSERRTSARFREDERVNTTRSGIQVRSKSETIIANELDINGIPFEYEQQIWLRNGKPYLPDFTVFDSTGEKIYWEHLGMLDNDNYISDWIRKEQDYARSGISVENGNLIVTKDDEVKGGIDSSLIADIARKLGARHKRQRRLQPWQTA